MKWATCDPILRSLAEGERNFVPAAQLVLFYRDISFKHHNLFMVCG